MAARRVLAARDMPPSAAVRQRSIAPSPSTDRGSHPGVGLRKQDHGRGKCRDLQSWSSHAGVAIGAGGSHYLASHAGARRAQTLQGAPIWQFSPTPRDYSGCVSGLDVEQRLNHANVLAALDRWVAKLWRSECSETVCAGRGFGALEQSPELTRRQRLITATGNKHWFGATPFLG